MVSEDTGGRANWHGLPIWATISAEAAQLVRDVREGGDVGIMESFLAEYGLSTKEGVALM